MFKERLCCYAAKLNGVWFLHFALCVFLPLPVKVGGSEEPENGDQRRMNDGVVNLHIWGLYLMANKDCHLRNEDQFSTQEAPIC